MSQSIEHEIVEDDVENIEESPAEEDQEEVAADDERLIEPLPVVALEDPVQQKRLIEACCLHRLNRLRSKPFKPLVGTADVGFILTELQEEYSKRGVNLVRLEDSWAFRTAKDVGPYLALTKKEEKNYPAQGRRRWQRLRITNQLPVPKLKISVAQTNKGTLDVLLEAGWIKPGRRRETPGRPVTWITTNAFLDEFGISLLTDLPDCKSCGTAGHVRQLKILWGQTLANGDSAYLKGREGCCYCEFDQETDDVEEENTDVVADVQNEEDEMSGGCIGR